VKDKDALVTLGYLHPGEAVFEIRAFVGDRVHSGYFNDRGKAAEAAGTVSGNGQCKAVYVTMNPCDPALLARAENRVRQCKGKDPTTADRDITRLCNLLIDVDPERPSGISSSDQEHAAALAFVQQLRDELSTKGWPEPLMGDSGNGAHLLYKIDLPNTDASVDLLKRALKGLHERYAGEGGKILHDGVKLSIDQKVFNPARITKVFGTWARKGDSTQERPHRQARIISFPIPLKTEGAPFLPVSMEQLSAVASAQDQKAEKLSGNGRAEPMSDTGRRRLDVRAYLEKYGVEVIRERQHGGATLYVLRECLFDPSHQGGEAAIGQGSDGKLIYQCFHDSCKSRTWHDARQIISGSDLIMPGQQRTQTTRAQGMPGPVAPADPSKPDNKPDDEEAWAYLSEELFSRIEFPWEILPPALAQSLQKLAKSCATSPTSLPGCAFAIAGSVVGRTLSTSPKDGWEEPSIIWCADIRPTGSGKTPAANSLMKPIHGVQAEAHRKRQAELEYWKGLPRKERETTPEPPKERAWFISDLTLEGLRDDLEEHPTGGVMVLQEELSAFISSQNQYRNGKGSDREAWLSLYDGNEARVKRAGRDTFLRGSRVNIFGGIQPAVFRRVFSSEDGLYLVDGTAFRFLYTYEEDQHFPLDCTAWGETHSLEWARFIQAAIWWTEKRDKPHRMILNSSAQARFISWRNEIFSQKPLMPEVFRGFIPKAAGHSLRLAGIIHFLHRIMAGKDPDSILSIEDIERGITAVQFYLGQAVDAMRLIHDQEHKPDGPMDPRVRTLAETLDALKDQVDNGRLAVSFVRDEFNRRIDQHRRFSEKKQSKAFGLFLRKCGLRVSDTLHDANGQERVRCLEWDDNANLFIKDVLDVLDVLETKQEGGLTGREHEKSSSRCSRSTGHERKATEKNENMQNTSSRSQNGLEQGQREEREDREEVSRKQFHDEPPPIEWTDDLDAEIEDMPEDAEVF